MSGETAGMSRALTGFAMAATAIGTILIAAKWMLIGIEFAGGPDLRFPDGLSNSAVALVFIGLVTTMLLKGRSEKEQG